MSQFLNKRLYGAIIIRCRLVVGVCYGYVTKFLTLFILTAPQRQVGPEFGLVVRDFSMPRMRSAYPLQFSFCRIEYCRIIEEI